MPAAMPFAPPPIASGEALTMYDAARVVGEQRPELKARALDVLDWGVHGYPVGPSFGPRLAVVSTGGRYTTTRTAMAEFLAAIKDLPRT